MLTIRDICMELTRETAAHGGISPNEYVLTQEEHDALLPEAASMMRWKNDEPSKIEQLMGVPITVGTVHLGCIWAITRRTFVQSDWGRFAIPVVTSTTSYPGDDVPLKDRGFGS